MSQDEFNGWQKTIMAMLKDGDFSPAYIIDEFVNKARKQSRQLATAREALITIADGNRHCDGACYEIARKALEKMKL